MTEPGIGPVPYSTGGSGTGEEIRFRLSPNQESSMVNHESQQLGCIHQTRTKLIDWITEIKELTIYLIQILLLSYFVNLTLNSVSFCWFRLISTQILSLSQDSFSLLKSLSRAAEITEFHLRTTDY